MHRFPGVHVCDVCATQNTLLVAHVGGAWLAEPEKKHSLLKLNRLPEFLVPTGTALHRYIVSVLVNVCDTLEPLQVPLE